MKNSCIVYTIDNLRFSIVSDDSCLYIDAEEIGEDELEDYVVYQLGHSKIPQFGTLEKCYDSDGQEYGRYFMILQTRDDEHVRKKIEAAINEMLETIKTRADKLLKALPEIQVYE